MTDNSASPPPSAFEDAIADTSVEPISSTYTGEKHFGLRPLLIDEPDEFVEQVIAYCDQVRGERQDWLDKHLARYAKMRGWLELDHGPWDNSSDQHVPIIMTNVLRSAAGIFNAVVSNRPVIKGRPTDASKAEVAERNDYLLDHQFFVDNEGERFVERYVDQFVIDGTVVSIQPRVIERRMVNETRTIRRPTDTMTLGDEISRLAYENEVLFSSLKKLDDNGGKWEGTYTEMDGDEKTVTICVYDNPMSDSRVDVCFCWDIVVFDSPTAILVPLEDILVPVGAENLQPVSSFNVKGAQWVVHVAKFHIDSIKRKIREGVYDLLTEADIEEIEAVADGRRIPETGFAANDDQLTQAKEADTGISPWQPDIDQQKWITVYTWYGSKDCDGDGLEEEIIATVLVEPRKLARARHLTESYPGIPPRRPFAEARFIPVEGQFYGMGLVELLEGLSDFIHELVNDNVNAGRLASVPWFVYRAGSGFKPEVLRMGPGDGIPVDNPATDLAFPQIPGKDQSWSFNMIGMASQWIERLAQISALQFGQVPQGKASALRTVGTTMAILQQSAALPEQILRRVFMGLRDIFSQFHLLNTRYLPPRKKFLVTGKAPKDATGYDQIDDRSDINIPLAFDFQSTLANTNKGVVSQALQALGAAIINPIGVQMGLVTPENLYNWSTDLAKAFQLDPARYISAPPNATLEPKIPVQAAMMDLATGVMPASMNFVEPLDMAVQQLTTFLQTGMVPAAFISTAKNYVAGVQQKLMELQQRQAMMQAAQQMSQQLAQSQASEGGRPPGQGSPPEMQTQAPTQAETQGGAIGGAH